MEEDIFERAYYLVGKFMNSWAIAEFHVDEAIAIALELNEVQSVVISKLFAKQKLEMLALLIETSKMGQAKKKHFGHIVKRLKKLSEDRNMVAHSVFGPNVDLSKVAFARKKQKVGYPNETITLWSEHDFASRFDDLFGMDSELTELKTEFKEALAAEKNSSYPHKRLLNALMGL